jgi:serine/threonine protein kinase
MSASTDPAAWRPPPAGEQRTAREWLDALARGACDQASFTQAVDALVQASEDEAWEVLSLLDQYYRRGKIPADQFRSLKAHVDRLVLGSPRGANSGGGATAPQSGVAAVVVPGATRAAARPRPPAVGDVLRDRYELAGVLGKGGMGTVFEAVDRFRVERPEMGHKLAIKVLHSVVLDQPGLFDELRSEFQHLQSLSHPNIVRVHEFDRDGDTAFFTMELLDGAPLSALLAARKNGALPREYALALIRDIGAAVAHAHSRNVVHGDLNPQNIFLTQSGEVRVLDFGASHKLEQTPWVSDFEDSPQPPAATPAFGSCQLLEGETADVRDDVFAFACVSYMLLTGRHPFQSRTAIEARTAGLRPKRPEHLSSRQWKALQAGLAFERERRPADVQAWLQTLDLRRATPRLPPLPALMSAEPRSGTSPVLTAIVVGVVVILGFAVWSKVRHAAEEPTTSTADSSVSAESPVSADAPADAPGDAPAATPADAPADARAEALAAAQQPDAPANATAATTAPAAELPMPSAITRSSPPTPTPTATPPTATTPTATTPPAPAASPPRSAASPAPSPARSAASPAPTPPVHISLAAAAITVSPLEPAARVTVRRKGNLHGEVSFMWWTESGTAKPGVDFVAAAPQIAHIENGKNSATLLIPLVSDPSRRSERSFYVVIDDAGADSGARIIGTPTTIVTIPQRE